MRFRGWRLAKKLERGRRVRRHGGTGYAPDEPTPRGILYNSAHDSQSRSLNDLVSLKDFKVGESGEIVQILSRGNGRLARLGAYGVTEGSLIFLIQSRPAFIIRIGETELALDADLARDVFLKRRRNRGSRR